MPDCSGKQVKILYEPVAVRHKSILSALPEATFREKSLELIREGRPAEMPSRNIRTGQNPSVSKPGKAALTAAVRCLAHRQASARTFARLKLRAPAFEGNKKQREIVYADEMD